MCVRVCVCVCVCVRVCEYTQTCIYIKYYHLLEADNLHGKRLGCIAWIAVGVA